MPASRRAQPYRANTPRGASPALDAMQAGRAGPNPGLKLARMGGGSARKSRLPTVLVPRVSAQRPNLRAQWPVKTQP